MAPRIDDARCNLCGVCVENCPGDCFDMDAAAGRLLLARPVACWHCGTCEVDCPVDAIYVELPIMMFA